MTAHPSIAHPAFCSSILPAETLGHLLRGLDDLGPLNSLGPTPLGLWLSRSMLDEALRHGCDRLRDQLLELGYQVVTANGFPFGGFHGPSVKTRVYHPDWRTTERVGYTLDLARCLVDLLPDGVNEACISTVPVGWGRAIAGDELPLVYRRLGEALQGLDRISQERGVGLGLALEPEPGCYLQTSRDAARFFGGLPDGLRGNGLLGLCLDTCHHAVMFEEPGEVIGNLEGVPILKVQASSALEIEGSDAGALVPFTGSPYLHQTMVRLPSGRLRWFEDLPLALGDQAARAPGAVWRVHLHVPVFQERLAPGLRTTRAFLRDISAMLGEDPPLVEVETYTWSVLPEGLRGPGLAQSIARELAWVRSLAQWREQVVEADPHDPSSKDRQQGEGET